MSHAGSGAPRPLWRRTIPAFILATPLAIGAVFLSACSDDDPAEPPPHVHSVATLAVTPASVSLKIGETATLVGEAQCGCGAAVNVDLSWTSSDAAVATVEAGTVTALTLGSATITVAAEDEIATATVLVEPTGTATGPEGGTVVSADGNVELEIPAGALDGLTDVVIEAVDPALFAGEAQYIPGTGYQLRPDGLQLRERARIRIRFDPNLVPPGVFHEQLRIRERDRDGNQWKQTQQNQLQQQNRIQAEIEGFGVYAILFEPAIGTMVGPAGGTVLSADGLLEIMVPAGALSDPIDITVEKVDDGAFAGDPLFIPGTAYDLKPAGLQLQTRARLRIHYDPANLPPGLHQDQLRIQERDRLQNRWRDPSQCTNLGSVVESWIQTFGLFAITGYGIHVPIVASVSVSPSIVNFEEGAVFQMSAEVRDEDGNLIDDAELVWSSSDPTIATVSQIGLVTGLAEGTAVISAEAKGTGISGNAPVNVHAKAQVASVVVLPGVAGIDVGGTIQLTAEVRDLDGNLISRTVTWQSSNTAVATVNNGLVTGLAPGAVVITARTQNVAGQAQVTVSPPVASVVITDPGREPLEIGLTMQLTATAYDANGLPAPWPITWVSSDETIASVDNSGLVTGVSRGTVTITAIAGGASDAVSLRVVGESTGEEGTGNNLSWPVVFVDGVGITGQPIATETGLRPLASENIVVDVLPFWYGGNVADYDTYFMQQSVNTWQAEWIDGGGQPAYDAEIYWGDNLTVRTWSASRPIRIEQALSATGLTLTGFNMFYLYGQGPNEMQGADGTTASFTPLIYTHGPQLTIERIDGPGGNANWTVVDETVGSEINVGGRVIYGYNFWLDSKTPPTGTLEGWYRITFTLATNANCRITSIGNTEGTYLPEHNARSSWIDIYIDP